MTRGQTFPVLVGAELRKARQAHDPIQTPHEALGVIREEYWEFEQEVFRKAHIHAAMLGELVQLAAMAQKVAEDLELCPRYEPLGKHPTFPSS